MDSLLARVEDALARGDLEDALALCMDALEQEPGHTGAVFLAGEALRGMGRVEEAEEFYRAVTRTDPSYSDAWSGLAATRFDQLKLAEALNAAQRAIRVEPTNPEGYWIRSLIRERKEDYDGAHRDAVRANRLDPEGFPLPVPISDELLESVVEEVFAMLPPVIVEFLAQVAILVEEVPAASLCRDYDPPAAPAEILGYFTGSSLMGRSMHDPWSQLPSAIVLFRRNLQRVASNHGEMVEELRITLLHEVGHFLGLNEAELAERGLE